MARPYRIVIMGPLWVPIIRNGVEVGIRQEVLTEGRATRSFSRACRISERLRRRYPMTFVEQVSGK